MSRPLLFILSFGLILAPGLQSSQVQAQIIVNLTQAETNGLDMANLQLSLSAATEMEIELKSDNQNIYSKDYDLISLNSTQAASACENKQLLDLSNLDEFKSLLRKKNYLFKNKNNCTLNYANYSLVIAYPLINMVTTRPESPADFFDIERFPGMRALPDSAIGTLEWALLAYGIPINEVYQLLSTKRGLKLAFAKLESIKRHITWWSSLDELKQLIIDNKVSMVTGPHTVFYDLQFNHPMEILWNSQLLIEMKIGINAASSNIDDSKMLLSKLMADSPQFKLAYEYALGPTNKQTLKTLELLPQAGQILVFIPTFKKNLTKAIWMDYRWHNTLDHVISQQFKQWRNQSLDSQ